MWPLSSSPLNFYLPGPVQMQEWLGRGHLPGFHALIPTCMQEWLRSVTQDDDDEGCRRMAAACTQLHQALVMEALQVWGGLSCKQKVKQRHSRAR